MGKRLSAAAVEQYRREATTAPIRVLSGEDAARVPAASRIGGARPGRPAAGRLPDQAPSALHVARRPGAPPAVLDAVEDVLGPDLLCWNSSFFTKEASSPGYVSWHQDATYWGLSEPDVVTAWVAFTESTPRNGNMQVIPGSHRSQAAHVDTFHPDNLLSRGQEIAVEVDAAPGRRHRAGAGRDVAAPRPDRPRLAAQRVGRSADRLRHPLHPHPRAPGCRTRATAPPWCGGRTPLGTSTSSPGRLPISIPGRSPSTPTSVSGR